MHRKFAFIFTGILIAIGCSYLAWAQLARAQDQPGNKLQSDLKDLDMLKASAARFEKAFNTANATEVSAQFTENAEVVDEDDNVIEGRTNIEARFAELFKSYPKARIVVELNSLRQLSPDVALEEGNSTSTLNPDEPGSRSPYSLIHVKRDGKWLIARVRDFPPEATASTSRDQLQALNWLVGNWIDESSQGRVETSCNWSVDGNYLLQEYVVKARHGQLRGTQRIGWDPLRNRIRSWVFDDSGGYIEATWTAVESAWYLKVEGFTSDGLAASATRVVTPINGDSFRVDSTNIVVGNELRPDSSVRVVRRPPNPTE